MVQGGDFVNVSAFALPAVDPGVTSVQTSQKTLKARGKRHGVA